eukprot:jgi/Bigna1/87472/estExt_fgenesh1_pg.C_200208
MAKEVLETGLPKGQLFWVCVRFVFAKSFERIHRSNLVGMGVVPLQFLPGQDADTLKLDGSETISICISGPLSPGCDVEVNAQPSDGGQPLSFVVKLRLDTEPEIQFFKHGGVMPFVMRQLAAASSKMQ